MRSAIATVLPLAPDAGRGRRRAATAVAPFALLATAAGLMLSVAGLSGEDGINVGVIAQLGTIAAVVLCALRCALPGPDRAAWIALTVALAAWSIGNAYWGVLLLDGQEPEGVTLADVAYLTFYPAT